MIRKLPSGRYRLYSRKIDPKTGRRRNLGTFNFAAGSTGNVKITDKITGTGLQVMADAIRFVYVP